MRKNQTGIRFYVPVNRKARLKQILDDKGTTVTIFFNKIIANIIAEAREDRVLAPESTADDAQKKDIYRSRLNELRAEMNRIDIEIHEIARVLTLEVEN